MKHTDANTQHNQANRIAFLENALWKMSGTTTIASYSSVCTRFNINWAFMFLSSVYLICHCQFLPLFFRCIFPNRKRAHTHKDTHTHVHWIEFSVSTSKMESTTRRSAHGKFSIIQKDVGFWFILLLNCTDTAYFNVYNQNEFICEWKLLNENYQIRRLGDFIAIINGLCSTCFLWHFFSTLCVFV